MMEIHKKISWIYYYSMDKELLFFLKDYTYVCFKRKKKMLTYKVNGKSDSSINIC